MSTAALATMHELISRGAYRNRANPIRDDANIPVLLAAVGPCIYHRVHMDPTTPSTTLRRGNLQWLIAPVGGRDWLETDLYGALAADQGAALLLRPNGALERFDLRTLERKALRSFGALDGRYHCVALHGEHWAVALGDGSNSKAPPAGCWVDGAPLPERLDTLCFAPDGTLFGFRKQKITRVDRAGAVLWEGGERGSLLAVAGDRPVAAAYGTVWLPDASGELRKHSSKIVADPRVLYANERYAAVGVWGQSASSGQWCWTYSIWSLATHEERVIEVPRASGAAVILGDRLWWPECELNLETLELRAFELPPYGQIQESAPMCAVGEQVWALVRSGAVRRITANDHVEVASRPLFEATPVWSVAVANDGRAAVGRDKGWDLFSADGARLHREEGHQFSQVAISPSGETLAIGGDHGTRVFDSADLTAPLATVDLVGTLSFSRDGARLLLADENRLLAYSARTLETQALFAVKGFAAGAFAGDRIVAVADDKPYVFDDPGPLAPSKKPPKHKERKRFSVDAETGSGASVVSLGDRVAVRKSDGVALLDLATGKVIASSSVEMLFSWHGNVVAIEDSAGASLIRWGESTPFARLPAMPSLIDATPDGARVIAVVAEGVLVWSETSGRTPATEPVVYELPVPAEPRPLPGFGRRTEAFVLHGARVSLAADEALALAKAISEELAGVWAVPEGDASETGAASESLTLFVGAEVASTQAGDGQGEKGPVVKFDAGDFERAQQRFERSLARIESLAQAHAPSLDRAQLAAADARGDWFVTTGPLSNGALKLGKSTKKLSWDGAELSERVARRESGSLVCTYD